MYLVAGSIMFHRISFPFTFITYLLIFLTFLEISFYKVMGRILSTSSKHIRRQARRQKQWLWLIWKYIFNRPGFISWKNASLDVDTIWYSPLCGPTSSDWGGRNLAQVNHFLPLLIFVKTFFNPFRPLLTHFFYPLWQVLTLFPLYLPIF